MAGTREGGLKAARTLRAKRGQNYYSKIGRKGGQAEVEKGYSMNTTLASLSGYKGATSSRRRQVQR